MVLEWLIFYGIVGIMLALGIIYGLVSEGLDENLKSPRGILELLLLMILFVLFWPWVLGMNLVIITRR
jgi:hypothetical protein